MPEFTMALKKVIEATGGRIQLVNGQTRVIGGYIGLDHYPIFSESHRPILNGKIIDQYMNAEIGVESIELFQLNMRRKMAEIMPYYNQLYKTQLIEFDPMLTVDLRSLSEMIGEEEGSLTSSQEASTAGTSKTDSTSDSTGQNVHSDFPQQLLKNNGDYATSADNSSGKSTSTGEGQESGQSEATSEQDTVGKSRQNSESSTKGFQGSQSLLLNAYRSTIINVDPMVIEDLSELFMQVWSSGNTIPGRDFI